MKAIIYLNGVPDHKEPYDYMYCVRLAFKLDPQGKCIRVQVQPEDERRKRHEKTI